MSRFTPVTVGLPPHVADLLTRAAATSRLTRSELVRRIVMSTLLEDEVDEAVEVEVHPTRIQSAATGYQQHVLVEVDVVSDDACSTEKSRVAARNAAVLGISCPCGAALAFLELPIATRPSIDAAHPSARILPSVSEPLSKRLTVRAVLEHDAECPASAVKAHRS